MDYNGVIEQPKHKYMVPFLKSMPSAMSDKHLKNFLEEYPVHIDVPLVPFDWQMFINQAKLFFKVNFMPFIMFMCGAISTFHFQQIVSRVGKNIRLFRLEREAGCRVNWGCYMA